MFTLIVTVCVLFVNLVLVGRITKTMATVQDLQNDLQAVADGVAGLATDIASLKAAVAAGNLVSQAQLDELDAKTQAINASIAAAK